MAIPEQPCKPVHFKLNIGVSCILYIYEGIAMGLIWVDIYMCMYCKKGRTHAGSI